MCGGSLSHLPEDYKFPFMALHAFLTHWFLNYYQHNITAYILLNVRCIKHGRQMLYEIRATVLFIEERGMNMMYGIQETDGICVVPQSCFMVFLIP